MGPRMAERIQNVTFREPGRPPSYPLDQWTDGSQWKAVKGRDFACSVTSFRSYLRSVASSRCLTVHTQIRGKKTVVFQFLTKANDGRIPAKKGCDAATD